MGWLERKPGKAQHTCSLPLLTDPLDNNKPAVGAGSQWQCDFCFKGWHVVDIFEDGSAVAWVEGLL